MQKSFGYYPGCALHGAACDYEQSVQGCLKRLGVALCELDDWICCGATAAHSINSRLAVALPARNLGIAQKMGIEELLAPCPMCSMELLKSQQLLAASPALREEMEGIVELPLAKPVRVMNLIDIFQAVGIDEILRWQERKLDPFRVACYYGCLLTRPPKVVQFDDCEEPNSMETILSALGASIVNWNHKTECCGSGLTLCDKESVVNMAHKILADAADSGANCIVVACPMCQMNLDLRQADVNHAAGRKFNMPIYYLSDLIGLALGMTETELGIDRHFVAPRAVGSSMNVHDLSTP